MSFGKLNIVLLAIGIVSACGKPSTSFTLDVGGVERVRAVVFHFNKVSNTYELWLCPPYKAVEAFSDCQENGRKNHEYETKDFFRFIIQLLKTFEQDIPVPNHQVWVKTAAVSVLKDEMPEIEAEQARLKSEIEKIDAFIEFYKNILDPKILEEKEKRQLELKEVNDRFAELNIHYKKVSELAHNFIALLEDEGELHFKELKDDPTFGFILARLAEGFGVLPMMTFATIPAGSFLMGSPGTEEGRYRDESQHEVTISEDFQIQATEVTRDQWYKIMNSFPGRGDCAPTVQQGDHPVTCVSLADIDNFISELNDIDILYRYRLPTEAEWEYAARAGSGEKFSTEGSLEDFAWYWGNANYQTHEVAKLKPNSFGLYDVHGNVREWVSDRYGVDYDSDTSVTDPKGPSLGSEFVIRGGGWLNEAPNLRSASRDSAKHDERENDLGFRLVKVRK